jgi:hypothetical protein
MKFIGFGKMILDGAQLELPMDLGARTAPEPALLSAPAGEKERELFARLNSIEGRIAELQSGVALIQETLMHIIEKTGIK